MIDNDSPETTVPAVKRALWEGTCRQHFHRCYEMADWISADENTRVAAMIVTPDGEVVGSGMNRRIGILPGHNNKYDVTIHAEVDAICEAATRGISTHGCTMYCLWAACTTCALAIMSSGIDRVVSHMEFHMRANPRWLKSVLMGREMMTNAGVTVDCVSLKVGDCEGLTNGERWKP